MRVVLARAARSAAHESLRHRLSARSADEAVPLPQAPQGLPPRRGRPPVSLRYTKDTLARIEAFAEVRGAGSSATVLHGNARMLELGGPFTGVITSPPYPGLIDYHEQHRYAYELLGLSQHGDDELGRPANGLSRAAIEAYVEGVADVLANARRALLPGAVVCVVVNDRRELYPEILRRAGLRLEARLERHVNRRTGLRAGEYFESVLVCRAG